MVERPMDDDKIARYTVVERTDVVLKIEQRMPQEDVGRIAMKGMAGFFATVIVLIFVAGILTSSVESLNFRFLGHVSPVSYVILTIPFFLTIFIVVIYAIMRHAIVFTTAEFDKGTGSCTIKTITKSRSERQIGFQMKRQIQLGYINEFQVVAASDLKGSNFFPIRMMSKGMAFLILQRGANFMPFFIFSDFDMQSLQDMKGIIDEFLATRS